MQKCWRPVVIPEICQDVFGSIPTYLIGALIRRWVHRLQDNLVLPSVSYLDTMRRREEC